jgi:hypothetical protein
MALSTKKFTTFGAPADVALCARAPVGRLLLHTRWRWAGIEFQRLCELQDSGEAHPDISVGRILQVDVRIDDEIPQVVLIPLLHLVVVGRHHAAAEKRLGRFRFEVGGDPKEIDGRSRNIDLGLQHRVVGDQVEERLVVTDPVSRGIARPVVEVAAAVDRNVAARDHPAGLKLRKDPENEFAEDDHRTRTHRDGEHGHEAAPDIS